MKKPFVTKDQLEDIIRQYPTPFYLYDEKGIRENARRLRQAFGWNPGFREYFAVKATPNPVILDILRQEGCGVDCASLTELLMAQAVGFRNHDIMFSSNNTPPEEYVLARKLEALINLDDITHIEFLEQCASLPETICCRYNPGGDFVLQNQVMGSPAEAKFGFTYEQLVQGFRNLREKGVKNFGLHAFLASNTLTEEYYPALAAELFRTALRLREETGIAVRFINLSGGIGIPYRPEEKPNDILQIGARVRDAYQQILVPHGMGNTAVFTELGRFLLGPHGHLVATAVHRKSTHREYVGLDACAVNLMRPAMYGAYHHITVSGKENWPHTETYDVVGSLCENNDKFAIQRSLPLIEVGDRVVLHDTGAHGFSLGYNYNGKLRCAELLLCEDGSVRKIRRAETPADYFATLADTGYFNGAVKSR